MADDPTTDGQLLISIWCALAKLGEPSTTGFRTFTEAAEAALVAAERLGDAQDPQRGRASRHVAMGSYALQLAGQRPTGQLLRADLTQEALADFEIARAALAAPERKSA